MSLFTTPLTLNDGVADRIFNWLRQVPGVVAGLYRETAATAKQASTLKTTHTTEKSGRERHMLQRAVNVDLVDPGATDPTDDLVLVTVTVAHHSKHAAADVEKEITLVAAAMGITGFTTGLMAGEL